MSSVSSFPRYDLRTGLYNTLFLIHSAFSFRLLALLGIFFRLDPVSAAPAITAQFQQRDDQSTSSSSSYRIWVPILVVVIVVAIIALYVYSVKANSGGGIPRALSNFSRAAAIGTGTMMPTTTELTADQLTGNASTTSANDATNAANQTRRARRTRRTPSQISTTSLPVYMKEPGEQELVIIRGPQDMEDVPLEMPPLHEDGEQERYSPVPDSPQHMPLLDGDDGAVDDSAAALLPEAHEEPRSRSNDAGRRHSGGSSHTGESSSLVRVETNAETENPDPRGDAPAYFEVVDLNDEAQQRSPIPPIPSSEPTPTNSSTTAASSSTASRGTSSRRSLRNLFGWSGRSPMTPPGLPSTPAQSHARADSGGALSLVSTMSRPSTSNRHSHRPSQSSSSVFSVVNPLNRKKSSATLSSNHLTSPSSISLASISAPLTHTVVRTEYTYPKAGPTPEQLKLISSREAFARFGVPYGKDAIAFAASTQDLNPPPEFESEAGPSFSSPPRSQSQTRVVARESTGRSSESSGESNGTNGLSVLETPEIRVHESSRPVSLSVEPDTPATSVEPSSPSQKEPKVSDMTQPSSLVDPTASSKDIVARTEIPGTSNNTQMSSSTNSPKDGPPSHPAAPSASPSQHAPLASPSTPTISSKPPPTSFRNPPASEAPAPSLRSESRTSSFRSFETARESVNEHGILSAGSGSGTPTMSDSEYFSEQETEMGDSRPATPITQTSMTLPVRLPGGRGSSYHVLEGTDTTIRATA
ncbi:hypothetical protein F5876DRAFT_71745 [Lentinula aff. lateritia]|uniref:Uncharacterized protein n=1 Tax=Lentinula aff. lateritia TaxID=2804960 RepID=A0ACC1UG53_9AGAR|nr:hypothetical protein F5876DRAFT_71745 [Lentinula aff. lateritia]